MRRLFLSTALLLIASISNAAPTKWDLVDFRFDDGGTAYGSFNYDNDINQFLDINIFTTAGTKLDGRNFVATAGAWGRFPDRGILAFTDTLSFNLTGAGWFRIDANIDFNATPGTIVNQWLAVGAESFCVNLNCSSAANEITNPGKSRDTISGYLLASSPTPVPVPSSIGMFISGLAALGVYRRRTC